MSLLTDKAWQRLAIGLFLGTVNRHRLAQGSIDACTVCEDESKPLTSAHLREVDAAEQQSGKQQGCPLVKRAVLDLLKSGGDSGSVIGSVPCLANRGFGL